MCQDLRLGCHVAYGEVGDNGKDEGEEMEWSAESSQLGNLGKLVQQSTLDTILHLIFIISSPRDTAGVAPSEVRLSAPKPSVMSPVQSTTAPVPPTGSRDPLKYL